LGAAIAALFPQAAASAALSGVEARGITTDSRLVETGDVFVALKGRSFDGRAFAGEAVTKGAVAVLTDAGDRLPDGALQNLPWLAVRDAARCARDAALRLYSDDAAALRIVGVTGTNGKTSTTFLIKAALDGAARPCGLIGTVRYVLGPADEMRAFLTTPQEVEILRFLAKMRRNGLADAVMEVSSQGLDMGRVDDVPFHGAVFTNLTRDHLDYHGTMECYREAKLQLFRKIGRDGFCVANLDDPNAAAFLNACAGRRLGVSLAGAGRGAQAGLDELLSGRLVEETAGGIRIAVDTRMHGTIDIASPLLGRFNAVNCLCAAAAGLAMGIAPESIIASMGREVRVPGRLERVDEGQPFLVAVDYAHTPDALEKALGAVRRVAAGKVIVVFGCGGDRDPGKRPEMGRVAASSADAVVVTSDNPRSEEPQKIISQILTGIPGGVAAVVEPDRRKAIASALEMACAGDAVLIAGKGHEDYQIIGPRRFPFDDAAVAREVLRAAGFGGAS